MRAFPSLAFVFIPLTLASADIASAADKTLAPGDIFRDCENCPEMVVIPAGRFLMGAPESDADRQANEGPQHEVTIPAPFAVAKFEVTREQFAAFAGDTGWETVEACITYENGSWEARPGRTWRDPGFPQDASHAVDCVTFDDAEGYVEWLSRKTGEAYRLLTEAEWEYTARAGAATRFFFGDDSAVLCRYANGADQSAKALFPDWTWANDCDDRHPFTAPVGTFEPNGFGLYDVTGNVWEWVSDCFHDSYDGAPGDSSSWTDPDCEFRAVRGGGLFDSPGVMRLTFRIKARPTTPPLSAASASHEQ